LLKIGFKLNDIDQNVLKPFDYIDEYLLNIYNNKLSDYECNVCFDISDIQKTDCGCTMKYCLRCLNKLNNVCSVCKNALKKYVMNYEQHSYYYTTKYRRGTFINDFFDDDETNYFQSKVDYGFNNRMTRPKVTSNSLYGGLPTIETPEGEKVGINKKNPIMKPDIILNPNTLPYRQNRREILESILKEVKFDNFDNEEENADLKFDNSYLKEAFNIDYTNDNDE